MVQNESATTPVRTVQALLAAAVTAQAPRVQDLLDRLQLQAGIVEEVELEDALHALHASATALDFGLLQPGGGGSFAARKAQAAGAGFSLQASRLRAEAGRVATYARAFIARNSSRPQVAQRLLAELRDDIRVLETTLQQGAGALAGAAADEAIVERLHGLQAFCVQARQVQRLSQERVAGRIGLEATLQERVLVPGERLQELLRPLMAAAERPAEPKPALEPALHARQQLQAGLVQACAEIMRLHDRDHELGARLAAMAHKARLVA